MPVTLARLTAATLLGWVTATLLSRTSLAAQRNCGTCVVFPDPVSASNTTTGCLQLKDQSVNPVQ